MKKLIFWEVSITIVVLGIFFLLLKSFLTVDSSSVVSAVTGAAVFISVVGSTIAVAIYIVVGPTAVAISIAFGVTAVAVSAAGAVVDTAGVVLAITIIAITIVADAITVVDKIQAPRKWIIISLLTEVLIIFGVITTTIFY